jgi:transcriptional regulator with XRE-family HTH domain
MAKRTDPVDVRVGQRIRAYRLSRGISQSALGEKVGVTFQQIQKYERGANRLGSSRLKKVSAVLGVPIAALFGEDENSQGKATDNLLTELLSQPYGARLLRAFYGITDVKQRLALLRLAEDLAETKE